MKPSFVNLSRMASGKYWQCRPHRQFFVLIAFLLGSPPAIKADVTAVAGSAYGYFSRISLSGGSPSDRGPTPMVTLPPAGSGSPITATAPSGLAQYGSTTFFTSDQLEVSTQGTTGPSGSVTTSANIRNVGHSGNEVFIASGVAGTCNATASGLSGSSTITNGTLQTSETGGPGGTPIVVAVPANPAPNTTYEGTYESAGDRFRYVFNEQKVNPDGTITVNAAHQYFLGPSTVGDLIIGQSVCGVTAGPTPVSVVSRKTHQNGQTFDLNLPRTGQVGIESRTGGAAGNHRVVVTFENPVTVGGVTVISVDGMATASRSVNGAVVTIDLGTVANAQILAITLTNVNDGSETGNVHLPMGVLFADSNGDRTVNSGDAQQTRNRSGQTASESNFRSDYNLNGTIDSGDATIARSRSGTFVP